MVRRCLQTLRLLGVALFLPLLLAGCSTFGSTIPEEPPAESSYNPSDDAVGAQPPGLIRTSWYRATTPAGWQYRRLDPATNGGVFLLGRSPEGGLTYLAQRVDLGSGSVGLADEVTEATIDFLAVQYEGAGFQTAVEEVEGTTHIIGWSDAERVVTVVRREPGFLLLVSLEGKGDSVWLAEENRLRIAGSLTLSGDPGAQHAAAEGSAATAPVAVRMDGSLPEFRCSDPNWEWLSDEERGVVVTGTLGETSCVVSVSSRANGAASLELTDDGRKFALFTGAALYWAQVAEENGGDTLLLLQGDEETYTVAVEPSATSSGESLFTHPELLALLEHGIIFDQAELDTVAALDQEEN